LHLKSNGTDGLDLVHRLKLQGGDPGAIIGMVDERDNHGSVDSIPLVVDTVLRPPFRHDELEAAIKEAAAPSAGTRQPPEHALARIGREIELWRSPRMREVREIIGEAARIDITVRARTTIAVRSGGTAPAQTIVDSVVTSVALRNNRRW